MIQFNTPEWFFLIPLLLAAGWKYRRLRLASPLRLLLQTCLLLALAQPALDRGGKDMDLWVLVDQSNSTAGIPAAGAEEIQAILERHKHAGDRVRLVDFAQSAVLRGRGDPVFAGGTAGTDMEQALAYTMALMSPNRTNRILMLTDGWPTTPLDQAAEQLIQSRIPVDYRLSVTFREADIRIEQIRTPARIRPGEAFILEATLAGPPGPAITVPWQISKNGGAPLRGTATLLNGKATVRLADRLSTPGCSAYEMTITPQNDPIPENNRAVSFLEVTGGNGVLLLSGYDRAPLAPFLEAQGFRVQQPSGLNRLDARHLSGVGLVIINNLSASSVPPDFLHALDYYVREQGGGLLMCGGRHSFGSGGYFSSPIDELLPVSMEMKKDKMKLMTAMSIVLDRSGSMSCSVPGGKTKMDLANAGTCQTISLLSDQDLISVHAVDSEPHPIVTLSSLGPNRKKMISSVSRIASMGGGIFIGAGLKAGWRELQRSVAGTRHLLLFADADDSEEPADYRETLKEMVKEGATVSVIALGTEKSADAGLLREIAELGRGRIFFCDRPGDIPGIFAQETVSVARAAFIRERTLLRGTAGWLQIAAGQPEWPPAVDGYNLCYLRNGATAACVTEDGNAAPLVSFFYGSKQVLFNIGMTFETNRVTALIGPSGCGKSTLLRNINRMNDLVPDVRHQGDIRIDGTSLYDPRVEVISLRKRVGMVFQKYNPFPKSIYENIVFPLRVAGRNRRAELDETVERSLKGAALWDEVKDKLHESAYGLSGGQQQRLCIARAIANHPQILLMDEPCAALDPIATLKIEDLMEDLKKELTIVIVTHNMQQATRIADRTAFMYMGRLVEYGETSQIFTNPTEKETEAYITGRFS